MEFRDNSLCILEELLQRHCPSGSSSSDDGRVVDHFLVVGTSRTLSLLSFEQSNVVVVLSWLQRLYIMDNRCLVVVVVGYATFLSMSIRASSPERTAQPCPFPRYSTNSAVLVHNTPNNTTTVSEPF
jgi:hypothetical protein